MSMDPWHGFHADPPLEMGKLHDGLLRNQTLLTRQTSAFNALNVIPWNHIGISSRKARLFGPCNLCCCKPKPVALRDAPLSDPMPSNSFQISSSTKCSHRMAFATIDTGTSPSSVRIPHQPAGDEKNLHFPIM